MASINRVLRETETAALRQKEDERSASCEASTHSVPAPPTLNSIVDEAMRGKETARD